MLRRAVDDFKDRIIPLFAKVQSQSKQIDALTQDLHESDREKGILEVEIMNTKPLGTQVKQLKKKLEDAERNSHQAIALAEKAKDEVVQLRQSNTTLHSTAEELELDNRNLRDLLDRHSNAVGYTSFVIANSMHSERVRTSHGLTRRKQEALNSKCWISSNSLRT